MPLEENNRRETNITSLESHISRTQTLQKIEGLPGVKLGNKADAFPLNSQGQNRCQGGRISEQLGTSPKGPGGDQTWNRGKISQDSVPLLQSRVRTVDD